MYQTVGLSLIPLLAEALDLPLYRRVITGGALNVAGDYGARTGSADRDDVEQGSSRESVSAAVGGGTKGDETEDLYELLSEVKVSLMCAHAHNLSLVCPLTLSRYLFLSGQPPGP